MADFYHGVSTRQVETSVSTPVEADSGIPFVVGTAPVHTVFIVLCVVLVKRGETKILNHILFNLVTQAEREFGSGTGALKYAAVSDWIYQRLPAVLKLLFTEKDIDTMIEAALTEAKKQWGTNENVKNYIESDPLNGVEFVAVQTADKDGPEKYISG